MYRAVCAPDAEFIEQAREQNETGVEIHSARLGREHARQPGLTHADPVGQQHVLFFLQLQACQNKDRLLTGDW